MPAFTVLTIDDQAPILFMVASLLEELPDVETLESENSLEGLRMAELYRPDLILLDFTMPEIHGSEVFARLKASPLTKDIPVVIFTGTPEENSSLQKLRQDGAAFLSKPFTGQELFDLVLAFKNRR